jgi:pimeloyl-ACP methyl ester carboxylesterase
MNERKVNFEARVGPRTARISIREWRVAKPKGQVICLHGFGVTGAEYAPMAEALNQAGFDALLPDWIGHGDSEYFGDPAAYDWTFYVQCLGALFQRYHTRVTHYVGTSWGGGVLLIFLLSYKVLPKSATFVDVALTSSPLREGHVQVFEAQSDKAFGSIAEANAFLARQRPAFAQVPDRFRKYLDAERFIERDGAVVFKFDPAMLPAFAAGAKMTYDHIKSLPRIFFDALFLYAENSPYRHLQDFAAISSKLPHIRYREDLVGGHPPMLLSPEQFGPIVDFIKQRHPPS